MYNPLVSVIVPVYNVEKYLRQCVESVLSQTYTDIEIILVDDGSPDKCPEICDEYAKKDARIKVIHKENGGLSSARNAGLGVACGQYVMFVDSDDYWDDVSSLKTIRDNIDIEKPDILIFGMKKYYQKDKVFADERIPITINGVEFSHTEYISAIMKEGIYVASAWDKVYKRSLIEENNLRFVEGQLSEDIEWCEKILLLKPVIRTIPKCFYVYRQQNSNSITMNISRKNLENICDVIERYTDIGIKSKNIDVLHFTANQYVLWMTISNLIPRDEIKDLLLKMKKRWLLVNYCNYPYVKKVYKFRFLGFSAVRRLLGLYKNINKKH